MLTQKERDIAWVAGIDAYLEGVQKIENPYRWTSWELFREWQYAWNLAQTILG